MDTIIIIVTIIVIIIIITMTNQHIYVVTLYLLELLLRSDLYIVSDIDSCNGKESVSLAYC